MSEDVPDLRHEFFSWRGFAVGASLIGVILIVQSLLGFPHIWQSADAIAYVVFVVIAGLVVGTSSGSVLMFLIPPDQDVIGVAGFGSDDVSQHIALFLVILALVFPELFGFVLFYNYLVNDVLAPVWVLLAFAAPSAGFAASMCHRLDTIKSDLEKYFETHDRLDLTELEWLYEYGARTSVYRMGMIEAAAKRIEGLLVRGSLIVKEPKIFTTDS